VSSLWRKVGGFYARGAAITYRTARRIVVAIVGGTVLLVGIIMIVGPGPAVLVIPAGLAILGLEFAWARRGLRKIREKSGDVARRIAGRGPGSGTKT
jgi:tellurite resistance protein TerC